MTMRATEAVTGAAQRTRPPATGGSRSVAAPRAASLLLVAIGVLDILVALRPQLAHRFEFLSDVMPAFVASTTAGASVAVGVLLVALARGVWFAKRRAWRVTVALVCLQLVTQVVERHRLLTLMSAVLLILLLLTRKQFRGRSDPSSRGQVTATAVALFLAVWAVGTVTVLGLAGAEHLHLGPLGVVTAVAQGLVGIPSVVTSPDRPKADAGYVLLLSMAVTAVVVTGVLAFRTARSPWGARHNERAVRALLAAADDPDSLGYFATRDDRLSCWSDGGEAAVSYRVVAGTALAAGDPLGPREHWPAAMRAFLDTAQDHAWIPAVAAAGPEAGVMWGEVAGFSSFTFGDEAVLHPATFTLEGRSMRKVRQAVSRSTRAGNVVEIARLSALPPGTDVQLRHLADRWRGQAAERGFSMSLGRIDATRDPRSLVVTARRDGQTMGLLVLVPWGDDGASLDVMRRSPDATNGTTELMIATLLQRAPSLGLRRVSLNFVVLRDAIERAEAPEAPPSARLWGRTVKSLTGWTQVETLYRFTSKFHPEWLPRQLLYPSTASLPRVAWAYLDAESFAPRPWDRLRGGATRTDPIREDVRADPSSSGN